MSGFDIDQIDYSAFRQTLPAAEVADFRRKVLALEAARSGPNERRTTPSRPMVVGVLVVFALAFVGFLTQLLIGLFGPGQHLTWVPIELTLLFAFLTAASSLQVHREFAGKHWAERAQLPHFAEANGLTYRTIHGAPIYPGMIFRQGDARTVIDQLTPSTGRFFDLGTLEYWIRGDRARLAVHWTYIALRLDRKLPNMVLIAKENQGLGGSDLPGEFHPSQVLSLEGDFDKYFTLYCPKQYETDALYVFTPDLMALLIDNASLFDVEIIEDWMFVVVRKPMPPASEATYERLFSIIRTVGAKTLRQTKNYHDGATGSIGSNVVAPQGRALRRTTSVARVAVTTVMLAILVAVPIVGIILGQSGPIR